MAQTAHSRSEISAAPLVSALEDELYARGVTPWASGSLSPHVIRYLERYARGSLLLEIGCGTGNDARQMEQLGFDVTAIDRSNEAIVRARGLASGDARLRFVRADFATWEETGLFDVVYEKGFFHTASSPEERESVARKISKVLNKDGIWLSTCGAPDRSGARARHGAMFLMHIVSVCELYFDVLEVVKAPYMTADPNLDFEAWHCAFVRR